MQDECPTHSDQNIHWTTLAVENHMILMGSAKASQVCVCACAYSYVCVCAFACTCVCVSMLVCMYVC